ncbi:ATP synthase protein I [Evansella vedderi]|uniref:ATP synthase protein I n=1 Tax=Evansella vedderi TaxID=38282 RepID=A0ABU0A129_9BACI|nr:ATP synthase subunit I [Evansella vedderi]MDQ0257192.1 ATP synthase protein I [Evansella vedderi]
MNDYKAVAKRYCMYTVILIIIFLIIALFFTSQRFFLGLALGTAFSLLNLLSTYHQVKSIGTILEGGTVRWTFGTATRIITAVLGVFIGMQFPQYFDLMGVIIGLMITYVLILIEPIFFFKQLNNQTGAGEGNREN